MGNLTKDQVRDLSTPGRYSDGDGLILKIGPSGGKSWILRVQVNGRRRDIGLGDSRDLSLRAARAAAADLRKLARAGIDPLEERRKEVVVVPTFKEATKKVHAELLKGWKNGKHTDQWLTTVEKYAYPKLGDLRVDQIEGPLVRDVLAEIWLDKPETARRLKQRIGTVLDWCYAKGFRPTEEAGTVLKPQRKGDRVPYSGSRRLEPIISASIAEIIIPFAENMAAYI